MALVPRGHVDLVALDLPLEGDLGFALDDTATELRRHLLRIARVDRQFARNLLVRQVQAHEVEAQHPHLEWLMMTGEHGPGEVVEAAPAGLAQVAPSLALRVIVPLVRDLGRVAVGASHPVRPTEVANRLVALGVVDQRANVEHAPTLISSARRSTFQPPPIADGRTPVRGMSLHRIQPA